MLKNGEGRQYDPQCPFDCSKWDECVCENTARLYGGDGFIGFTAQEIKRLQFEEQS